MFPILAEHPFMQRLSINCMSITTTRTLKNPSFQTDTDADSDFEHHLTVSTIVKTMLEIILIKKVGIMDKETMKQFSWIAKEIILLAEQTQ